MKNPGKTIHPSLILAVALFAAVLSCLAQEPDDGWAERSHGAYSGHLGELIRAWKAAEKAGALPERA